MNYSEKLRSPLWQKKRLEILQRDNFTCLNCGDNKSHLHVHHLQYLRFKDPWEYDNDYLITLCNKCHNEEEKLIDYLNELTGSIILTCQTVKPVITIILEAEKLNDMLCRQ